MTPRAVVWDIGNVLLDWSPDYLYRHLIPDDDARAAFFARLPFDAMNLDGDRGRLEPVVAAMAARHPEDAALILPWWAGWDRMCGGMHDETVAIRDALRANGVACWALTNFAADTWERGVALYPALGEFDGLVVSGREGAVKPDAAIYEIVEARAGTPPEALFFIDDRDYNVEAARERGWFGHVHDGADGLRAALIAAGFDFLA